MIDQTKRGILKAAALGASSLMLGLSAPANATKQRSKLHEPSQVVDAEPARFHVYPRISAKTNDVEVIIKNVGSSRSTITQITPSETITKRGSFDFSALLADGDLVLETGDHVTVPIIPHPVVLDGSTSAEQKAQSLIKALRASLSIVTEQQAFAVVDIDAGVSLT